MLIYNSYIFVEKLPVRLLLPYLFISVGSAAAALYGEVSNNAVGYVFLCIAGGCIYSAVCIAVPLLHAAEAGSRCGVPIRIRFAGQACGRSSRAAYRWYRYASQ